MRGGGLELQGSNWRCGRAAVPDPEHTWSTRRRARAPFRGRRWSGPRVDRRGRREVAGLRASRAKAPRQAYRDPGSAPSRRVPSRCLSARSKGSPRDVRTASSSAHASAGLNAGAGNENVRARSPSWSQTQTFTARPPSSRPRRRPVSLRVGSDATRQISGGLPSPSTVLSAHEPRRSPTAGRGARKCRRRRARLLLGRA
jgi:hypothetical protein